MTTVSQTNTQRAVVELRRMIFEGELSPGSDHLEAELAARLDMSRTPVREAALVLEAQGLLVLRPRKGVRIATISPQDMQDIYDVLTELESLAAANAAASQPSGQDLVEMEQALDDMEQALARDDLEAWSQADDAFHQALVSLGGNRRLQDVVAMMSDQVRRARAFTLYMRPKPLRSNTDHGALLEAIRKGDAARARHIHRKHRQEAGAMLVELLTKHRLKQL